ncbi:uncharacterized protein LOC101460042 [Ceratitis capitata]|uniref:uncharacterized protein LOC101460042 n=1 Tax=Ceratitis capitata TaxID=7213 RepID=UPI000A118E60|nr:uncharacterized protein LOC101460042 [Ceratitis capitata]
MTENKDKHGNAGDGSSSEVAHTNTATHSTAGSSAKTKSKDKENDIEVTVGVADQQHEKAEDKDTTTTQDRHSYKDEYGTQKVYKKTSPNCVLTLYLPSREITLSGNSPAILRGIIYVDPKAIQGYRVYAQLTLTFRYGREDEEVMGLRFCNEAIMSLHQVWPRNEEPALESLSPLQEALVKRLGDGAHPFTLTLTPQAPPSVQLVPAKRYHGSPIGTSYDVRCFIADKTDEKFHRRASVKMSVRVIYRTDVYQQSNEAENFTALINNQGTTSPPPLTAAATYPPAIAANSKSENSNPSPALTSLLGGSGSAESNASLDGPSSASLTGSERVQPAAAAQSHAKPRKSERGDSFPKLRLSPKTFRFSGRFGRSKSEVEKCPSDQFYNYSKSFQEYDCAATAGAGAGAVGVDGISGGGIAAPQTASPADVHVAAVSTGPQGSVDKPFLLQDGRVALRASLDKAWYTHGEDVCVTVNIKNDSRKTVRKVRVSAIQHVDVCMFSNGKFKNIVADSDTSSPVDRTVPPGGTLNTTVVLKPKRGQTKNWIALEDTLQRSTEPEEVPGVIAASAIRSPNIILAHGKLMNPCPSPAMGIPQPSSYHAHGTPATAGDDRNIFAIYVSYYVKVKLSLSPIGGELSLKLPFVLVHVEEPAQEQQHKMEPLALNDVPAGKRNGNKTKNDTAASADTGLSTATRKDDNGRLSAHAHQLDRIESVDDESIRLPVPQLTNTASGISNKRKLVRSETLAKDLDEDEIVEKTELEIAKTMIDTEEESTGKESELHIVQIHTHLGDGEEQEVKDGKPQEIIEDEDINVKQSVEPPTSADIEQLSQDEAEQSEKRSSISAEGAPNDNDLNPHTTHA